MHTTHEDEGVSTRETPVGEFKVTSGQVMVSDPCYDAGLWCQGVLDKTRKGQWNAHVRLIREEACDVHVAELIARHSACSRTGIHGWTEERSFVVGVDSGQVGFFDVTHYRDDRLAQNVERLSHESICPDEPWYSLCCDRTLGSKIGAGIIPYGVVSSSGYGDGSYRCLTQRDADGYVIAIRVVFITDRGGVTG